MSTTKKIDEASTLELLRSIEARGGSIAFQKDPGAFQDVIDEVNAGKTEEESVLDRLQEAKKSGQKEYNGQIEAIKKWAATHGDDAVRKLLPLLEKIQVDSEDESSLNTLKNKITSISQGRRSEEASKTRVLKVLQISEALGGSEGYKNYIESPHPKSTAAQKISKADQDDDYTWCNASGWVVSVWVIDWIEIHTDDKHKGSGYAWGFSLGYMGFWGSLGHLSWDKLMSATNSVFFYTLTGIIDFNVFDFYIDGSKVATLNNISVGVDYAIAFSGNVNWVEE